MPEIAALLTTRNRAALLPQVLAALERQSLAPDRFEVVAIDDGSTDETPAVLRAWQERVPLRILRQEHAGLAAAKNLGIFAARAPLIVFLDDDDIADPDLLATHLAAHVVHPGLFHAVLGRTVLAPEMARSPLMRHVTQVGCQLFSYGWMQPGQVLGHTEFWGGRSSCKRAMLAEFGAFNTGFRFGCEDIELGWRLAPEGLRVVYEPRALSVMIREIGFDDFCARSYRQGRSQWRFAALHPDPEVRRYCEIDDGLAAWAAQRADYAALLRWTRELDRLARLHEEMDMPTSAHLQPVLDQAYRESFALSRAKGLADAAALEAASPAPPAPDLAARLPLLSLGLDARRGAA